MIFRIPARQGHDCPYQPGAVITRKVPGVAGRPSLRIIAIRGRQRLGTVKTADANQERVPTIRALALREWRAEWVRRHDRAWTRKHPLASDAQAAERFNAYWARRFSWVIEVDVLEQTRCLAPQEDILSGKTDPGIDSERSDQYVSCAGMSIDRGAEGIDGATLARFTAAVDARRPVRRPVRADSARARKLARLAMFRTRP